MEMRPKTFLWIALAIVGIMIVGWVTKPPSLGQKIKLAGIHLVLEPNAQAPNFGVAYMLPKAQLPRLMAVLTADGYKESVYTPRTGVVVFHDMVKGDLLPILHNSQHVRIIDLTQGQVFFDHPLR